MTSILDAATSATVADAAYAYLEAGCSIIPLHGKQPAPGLKWQRWTQELPTAAHVQSWLKSGMMRGIGLIAGPVSGGLVLLDIDSIAACVEFETTFPVYQPTLTVRSGSGRGKHYYFYSHILPFNAYHNGVELRAAGAYVVAPPSLHPVSSEAYRVERFASVRRVYGLASVRRWILERGNGGAAKVAPRRPTALPAAKDSSAYGRAALRGECAAVAHAPEGTANKTLYRAALKLGSLVAAGKIGQSEVEIELEAAASALSARDGLEATRRTIASGLRTGLGNPRPEKVG